MTPQTLYYGDCLDWMRKWPSECVDLIYLDPPFNSNTDYNILFGTENNVPAQMRAFTDTWHWDDKAAERTEAILNAIAHPAHQVIHGLHFMLGESGMLAYLTYMAERLAEMQRLLKPTGSIYLHCDPYASHYLKAVMDSVFGNGNFRREVIWQRSLSHGGASNYNSVHDTILYYSKTGKVQWNPQYQPHDLSYIESHYRLVDEDGRRYQLVAAHGSGSGPARRFGNRLLDPPSGRHWAWDQDRIDDLMAKGRIVFTRTNMPRYKRYLEDTPGKPTTDVWIDIPPVNSQAKERLGYPTQKPRALLERIIEASSNPGDLVLDPFAGCGTTVDAAQRLGRRWAGIDISSFAIDLVQEYRLKPLGVTAHIEGIPADLASARRLAELNRFDFESWAIYLVPGLVPNKKKTGDGGIDGRGMMLVEPDNTKSRLVLAQVKSGHFSLSQLRDFIGVVGMEDAALGLFITLESVSTPSAQSDVARMGNVVVGAERYPRVGLWSIQDYFDRRRPHVPPMLDPFTGKPMTQPGLPQTVWSL